MPVRAGRCFNNCVAASNPPAEAPIPTIGNEWCLWSDLPGEATNLPRGLARERAVIFAGTRLALFIAILQSAIRLTKALYPSSPEMHEEKRGRGNLHPPKQALADVTESTNPVNTVDGDPRASPSRRRQIPWIDRQRGRQPDCNEPRGRRSGTFPEPPSRWCLTAGCRYIISWT